MRSLTTPFKCILFFVFLFSLSALFCLVHAKEEKSQQETKKEEKTPVITEEILVVGEVPKDRPISSVTILDETQIEQVKPLDLSEAIRYAPGVSVTFGDKSVYTLKLRGVDSRRIALLVDGIPVYEPYYSTFDLKTVSADGIDSLKLTRGPSSVLYGPNTLGGIVNVITQRPSGKPTLSLHASYGELNTRNLGLRSGFQMSRWAFSGSLLYQDSDGYYIPDEEAGERLERANTDYQRVNLNGKFYLNPSNNTEILLNAGIYLSDYGMPPDTVASRPRYWRFKKWNRYSFNAGGYTALSEKSMIRYRAFYVQHDNVLNMFTDPELTRKRFESTHDNSIYGIFGLADIATSRPNQLKFSLSYQQDIARTQDDTGDPWNEYDQGTFSLGLEDHLTFADNWVLVGGLSLDYLNKFTGENTSRLNPLIGIKYTPIRQLDMHFSFSQKSRFPSMRSMYSDSSGNPDLLSEKGTIWELGFIYNEHFLLSGAVFLTRFKDLIDSVRLPEYDFERIYFNIGKARIDGFELQLQKAFPILAMTLNYTFLDHWNESDDQPLTALSKHNLNFDFQAFPLPNLRLAFLGLLASSSSWLDIDTHELREIPSYFNLDVVAAYRWNRMELFLKVTNVFDKFIYTELGFPWRGRYFELGFRVDVLHR
jgi:iron complex outermembrane receptor protein